MGTTTVVAPTSDPELGGFTYVKRRHRTKVKATGAQKNVVTSAYASEEITVSHIREKYHARDTILRNSQFFQDFQRLFQDRLDDPAGWPRPTRLKLLGIGTLTHNPSLTQLSLGLVMASMLAIPLSSVTTSDPMYTAVDKAFLRDLGFVVVEPEDGVEAETMHHQVTLIFAPHVPKSVYESIFRTYWSHPENLILLGNDVRHYLDIYTESRLKSESPAIWELAQASRMHVDTLPQNFEYNNVFNDLAMQRVKEGSQLPKIDFGKHEIETERFETNQDDVRRPDAHSQTDQSNLIHNSTKEGGPETTKV